MCTVTLIPIEENNFILTSNRDEDLSRKTLFPKFYEINNIKMLFPKDSFAGGTWIGLSEKKNAICLLNGGFKRHKRLELYKQSRGVVVKDLLQSSNIEKSLKNYDCKGVEPFTIIAINWQSDLLFYELVWDGQKKHIRPLTKETHIWSSSTLYSEKEKTIRKEWFADFKKKSILTSETLLEFHKNAGVGDKNIDLQINRGALKTRSITQISKKGEEISMRHESLQSQKVNTIVFEEVNAKH